ncbi:hypothetical protein Poly30_05660 [Planctomycetes bacterium Poly30]|uniref:DUF1853 domain-containing protein n=1 Tax=Saltatorellus ferox TaxID=2528018 RepID=A0A518ELY7_9BACT|nr:hypothetical protein Poly30_05660 [Planctomycetes bacterium Poly30]
MTSPPPLRNRVVRDLWWAVTAPGLVDEDSLVSVPRFDPAGLLPSFVALDADPGPLRRAVAGSWGRERIRLGAYFEDLLRFFVVHIAGHGEAVSGVVIREGTRTVGELDLLFRDGATCHHWELAVKFYLHVPNLAPDPGDCFVGPQTRDRLHKKLARVRRHQLPLAKDPAAANALAAWQPLRSAALLRGRLFYPATSPWRSVVEAPWMAPDHLRGWWLPFDRCEELLPHAHSYALLTRREWLAPIDATNDPVKSWSRERLCAWAQEAAASWPEGVDRSHVVAGLDADGIELHRGFLVSVGWPGDLA